MSFDFADAGIDNCVFCSIVAGESEAKWVVTPSGVSNVACFHNQLKWARVMLLIVTSQHMTQGELWSSDVLIDAAKLAVEMGDEYCGEEGYRLISNFGLQAHQSQSHGHIHVVSGTSRLIRYGAHKSRLGSVNGMLVDEFDLEETPYAAQISPNETTSQRDLWDSELILETSRAALEVTKTHSPDGYRLLSSFDPAEGTEPPGGNPAGLFLLGGGQLGLYV